VARFPAKSHDQARKGHTPSRLLKKNSGVSPRHSRTERNASDETDAPSPSRAKSFRPFRFRELVKLPLRKRGEQSAVRRESTRARARFNWPALLGDPLSFRSSMTISLLFFSGLSSRRVDERRDERASRARTEIPKRRRSRGRDARDRRARLARTKG